MTESIERISSYIQGRDIAQGDTFEKRDPVTGRVNALVDEASAQIVDQAVSAARRTQREAWRSASIAERADVLDAIADTMQTHLADLVSAEIADTGKLLRPTTEVEIPRAIANFRVFAQLGRNLCEEQFVSELGSGQTAVNTVLREPLGTIGIIAPWNLPLLLLTWKVAPALVCGNAVVVKPSEFSPRTALLLAKFAIKAGLPAGLLNVVHGHGANAAGAFLTSHPDINAVTFTGETATGEAIMVAAAKGVRPVSLELGGKNAAVLLDDCDLEAALAGTMRSVFENAGQVCLTTERLFVHRSVFDTFTEKLAAGARSLRAGDPTDPATGIGPVVSDKQKDKVLSAYRVAAEQGAQVLAGGGVPEVPDAYKGGYWVAPTLWTGLPDTATVCRREVFGPCAHISVFDDDEEVIARVNDSPYGLAATVWGKDSRRLENIGRRIDAGTVWINCWRVRDERTAFGGYKKSGVGREGGQWSLDFYSELKTLCVLQ